MNIGGYQILDFSGVNFILETPSKIEGIYSKLSASKKPVLITNLFVNNKEIKSVMTCSHKTDFYDDNTDYEIRFAIDYSTLIYISISKSDDVVITQIKN